MMEYSDIHTVECDEARLRCQRKVIAISVCVAVYSGPLVFSKLVQFSLNRAASGVGLFVLSFPPPANHALRKAGELVLGCL